MRPSFIYHQVNAVVSILATIIMLYYFYINRSTSNIFNISIGLFIISIAWGIHSILHYLEEYIYNFNPLEETKESKFPIRGNIKYI